MSTSGQSGFNLPTTKIIVEGAESDLIFHNLVIHQAIADVNSCTFIWRQPGGQASLSAYVSFYQKYLSKDITIKIDDRVVFKGLITSINCLQGDELGVHYEIKGKGLFARLDEVTECNTFPKKTIKDIFTALNTAGLSLKLTPASSAELFYTVQYNQTTFDFYRMMAMRHGEWLYDNGAELVLGPPAKQATAALRAGTSADNIMFNAEIRKASFLSTGFDQRKGDTLEMKTSAPSSGAQMISASVKAGEGVFPSHSNGVSIPHVTTTQVHKVVNELHTKSVLAAAVYISAHSYVNQLRLGGRIKMQDENGGDSGEYIITEIHHFCSTVHNYENQFSAVPAEVEVPPYTNPLLYPRCKPQPALVVDNVDKDGLDRIMVRFPWQKATDSTPWINVLTAHAGKGKGMRFLPEIGEEVMIGFIDDNAEKPFFMGAIHTEKNKSEDVETGNNLKVIGTLSNRRLEIDDDKGLLTLTDNLTKETTKNALAFQRKGGDHLVKLSSEKSAQDYSAVQLTNGDLAGLSLFSGGQAIAEVRLEAQGNKITIHARGNIEIKADQGDITMSAMNININATQQLKIEGKMGVEMKGAKMALTADSTMDVKGLATTVEGSAKVDLKAGGMASIAGALVKIN